MSLVMGKAMGKEADRTKHWRERKKAEGKTSLTVMLSQEARIILREEKEKTGETYSVIMEKALQMLKKQSYRLPTINQFPMREEVMARTTANNHQLLLTVKKSKDNGDKPRILIDDFANYPDEGSASKQLWREQNSFSDLKLNNGFITRLFRSSTGFRRRKKWFK